MEDAWETKDENLISDIRDFERIYNQMNEQMRKCMEQMNVSDGDTRETMSFVDLQAAIIIYDPVRLGSGGEGVPPWVIARVNFRPIKAHMPASETDVLRLPAIAKWQREQFKEIGYLVLCLPLLDLQNSPQGRRRLDATEIRVRDALELWTSALAPEIDRMFRSDAASRTPRLSGQHKTFEDYLIAVAPDIFEAAKKSAAGRTEGPLATDADIVAAYLNAIKDEGRKHRIGFLDGATAGKLHGEALHARMKRLGTSAGSVGRIPSDMRILTYAKILNALSKARRIITEVMSERVRHMNDYQWSMDRIEEEGAHRILSSSDDFQKRFYNAARKVVSAQTELLPVLWTAG